MEFGLSFNLNSFEREVVEMVLDDMARLTDLAVQFFDLFMQVDGFKVGEKQIINILSSCMGIVEGLDHCI